jgi:hypothetical protein
VKPKHLSMALVVLGVAIALALAALTRRGPEPNSGKPLESRAATRDWSGGAALRGFAMELYKSDPRYTYEQELRELAELKTQILLIVPRGCQEDVNASRVFLDHPNHTPDEVVIGVIKRARELKMQVLVQPIILLWDTNSSEDWRGVIQPRRWDRWWDSYTRFMVHWARLCQESGAEMLSVGSELISTETMDDRWREVIRAVRREYRGKLLYSANWDHYTVVTFWDALDLIGMTSYYTLSKSNNPTLAELNASWTKFKGEILSWQRTQGKPIIFTEVGYASQDGCAREPWNYYASTRVNLQAQYLCLQSFFETWQHEPAVGGICVWKWEDGGGPTDIGYTPRGKPAEALLRRWLARAPLETSPSSRPAPAPDTRPAPTSEPDFIPDLPDDLLGWRAEFRASLDPAAPNPNSNSR